MKKKEQADYRGVQSKLESENDGKFFRKELRVLVGKLAHQGRWVLFCLNNFCRHIPELQRDNIQLVFFLPNTTTNSQPLNELKRFYKKILLHCRLKDIDERMEFKFTLLDALQAIWRDWV